MATAAPSRGRDLIDPHRPAEYSVVLGQSLKDGSTETRDFMSVACNWLPKVPTDRLSRTVKRSTGGAAHPYTLHLADKDRKDRDYFYGGDMIHSEANSNLMLLYDKDDAVFRLESITSAFNFNLTSASGQSSADIEDHSKLPVSPPKTGRTQAKSSPSVSTVEQGSAPSSSGPDAYDWRNFVSIARDFHVDEDVSISRSPMPGQMSITSSPTPGTSRFHGTTATGTPKFHPVSTRMPLKRQRDDARQQAATPRSHPAAFGTNTSKSSSKKQESQKTARTSSSSTSKSKPLSKEKITASDSESSSQQEDTITVKRGDPLHAKKASYTRRAERSPHIVVDDPSGLEIDMGSPPRSVPKHNLHLNRDAFRSYGNTPKVGALTPSTLRRQAAMGDASHHRNVSLNNQSEDDHYMEDGDIEHFNLGSPKQSAPSATSSGAVQREDEEDEDDDLAKELEAALEEEDERQVSESVGLGIQSAPIAVEDESDVSEEE